LVHVTRYYHDLLFTALNLNLKGSTVSHPLGVQPITTQRMQWMMDRNQKVLALLIGTVNCP
jgi:hypothetical protein